MRHMKDIPNAIGTKPSTSKVPLSINESDDGVSISAIPWHTWQVRSSERWNISDLWIRRPQASHEQPRPRKYFSELQTI